MCSLATASGRAADWNRTATDYPKNKTIPELFEEIARECPDRIAILFGDERLTYAELNSKANRLARLLRQRGVERDVLVGCCLERSLELVIGILAILKAGGAYVPLDANYPQERIHFMMEDARAPFLLAQRHARAKAPVSQLNAVHIDSDWAEIAKHSDEPLPASSSPTDLAYAMYTSGSTGRPKGVMVEHRSVVRLVRNADFMDLSPRQVFLQFAPTSFDASTLELWGPLLNGGKLAIMPPGMVSLEELGRAIRHFGVTTLWLAAGLFHAMVDERLESLASLEQLLAGGDVLSPAHVRMFVLANPNCRLINGYGPTEGTTFTCCHTVTAADLGGGPIPIGRPISNTRVYLLSADMRPVSVGEPGEICAAGDGVARGYLNQPELTAKKFVTFREDEAGRVYKTGDLGRYRVDGTIEFLGRVDEQVKRLGFRIEPGEIEAALRCHPSVTDTVVIVRKGSSGDPQLIAYVTSPAAGSDLGSELLGFLRGKLPPFMVPQAIQVMASFALGPNGKIDRSKLPAIARPSIQKVANPPETSIESVISQAWKKVLRIEYAGVEDHFFDLGGDSLQLLQVHAELQRTASFAISVMDLFEFPTTRALARHLSGGFQDAKPAVEDRARKQREAHQNQRIARRGIPA